ncbi:hypothetical protein VUR80DRAFT_4443 [Thermomyces stellatus]
MAIRPSRSLSNYNDSDLSPSIARLPEDSGRHGNGVVRLTPRCELLPLQAGIGHSAQYSHALVHSSCGPIGRPAQLDLVVRPIPTSAGTQEPIRACALHESVLSRTQLRLLDDDAKLHSNPHPPAVPLAPNRPVPLQCFRVCPPGDVRPGLDGEECSSRLRCGGPGVYEDHPQFVTHEDYPLYAAAGDLAVRGRGM